MFDLVGRTVARLRCRGRPRQGGLGVCARAPKSSPHNRDERSTSRRMGCRTFAPGAREMQYVPERVGTHASGDRRGGAIGTGYGNTDRDSRPEGSQLLESAGFGSVEGGLHTETLTLTVDHVARAPSALHVEHLVAVHFRNPVNYVLDREPARPAPPGPSPTSTVMHSHQLRFDRPRTRRTNAHRGVSTRPVRSL